MNKKFTFPLLITILAIVIISLIHFNNSKNQKTKFMPSPSKTIVVKGENKENNIKREKWIKEMHKAAPGTNWRLMDFKTRLLKYKNKKKKINLKESTNGNVSGFWKEVGSKNLAGRTHLVDVDTSTGSVYLASSGGNIWKGEIDSNNWVSINDQFQITGINMIRNIPYNTGKRLLVSSDKWCINGFFYSDDDGANWNIANGLSNIANWGYIKRAVVTNDNNHSIYLLALEWDYVNWNSQTTIYLSTDKGENFSAILSFDSPSYGDVNNFDLWTDYYGSGTVYLIENNNFYKFDDNNNLVPIGSFTLNATGSEWLTGNETTNNTYLYVLVSHDGQSDFYGSDDSGVNCSFRGTINNATPFMKNSFICSAKNPNVLYFGGVECYRSYDGGNNWTRLNKWWEYYNSPENKLHADIPGINSFLDKNANEIDFINTDGGTYISYDSLLSVHNISLSNLYVSQYYSTYTCRFNTNILHAGSQDQGYQMTTINPDSGTVDFTQVISGDYGHIVSGDDGASIWMVYPTFAAYYPDVNNNQNSIWWNFVGSGFYWMPPLMEDPSSPDKVYLAGGGTNGGSHIFHLNYHNGAISYEELTFDFSNGSNSQISAMGYSSVDTNYRYVLTNNGKFYSSSDGGNNWTLTPDYTGPGAHYFYGASILASPVQSSRVYIAGSGYSNSPVFVSNDYGQTFTAIDNGLPNTLVYELKSTPDESKVFAATELGPYVYIPSDNQWYDMMDSISPDQVYWCVDYIPAINIVRFGTYGRGIWDFVINQTLVADFTASSTDICRGDTINFTDQTSGNPTSWNWSFPGGEPSESTKQNPQNIIYNTSGIYDVTLTVSTFLNSDTKTKTAYITVNALPSVPETPIGQDSLCINSANTNYTTTNDTNAASYIWNISPDTAGIITGTDTIGTVDWNNDFTGTATIKVKALNDCGESSFSTGLLVTIYNNLGIAQNNNEKLNVNVFPNPTNGIINIYFDNSFPENYLIQITDIYGKSLMQKNILINDKTSKSINLSRYSKGIYFLIIKNGSKKSIKKIVVY